ncbi:hypothetical protein JL722_10297 [Aureococcus anophagefferens]|nr:hypothetical protein JL722_10297 [Aureococcus anophagefferens]
MASKKAADAIFPLNINVGIMGHVDSGKTSLVKALSTTLSTAALDKAPESKARGMTLDLGFSSFSVPLPDQLRAGVAGRFDEANLQFTLVDCPGHASLIRTIIGGSQIIDMMVLVMDVNKGIQTQTAECLVIGEITTSELIIVLNKVDVIPEAERDATVAKTTKRIRLQLASSKFANATIVTCAAAVGGEKVAAVGGKGQKGDPEPPAVSKGAAKRAAAALGTAPSLGLEGLVETLRRRARMPSRDVEGPFFFAIDHCFPIRGQGTVVTGTALRGACAVNDIVELPEVGLEKKVKSMQMFRKPVKKIVCGDRAGLCLSQLDAAAIERGIVAAPGSVPGINSALALVRKVRFFRGPCDTDRKFHVTLGHTTTLATAYFFGAAELAARPKPAEPPTAFDSSREYRPANDEPLQWCLLKFETRVRCQLDALVIGSNLEADALADKCRIAFHGKLVERVDGDAFATKVKLYKLKRKEGLVAKLGDPCVDVTGARVVKDVVGKDLFKKETNMAAFVGMKLQAATGEMGPGRGRARAGARAQKKSPGARHAPPSPGRKKKAADAPPSPPPAPPPLSNDRSGTVERHKGDPMAGTARYETIIAEGFFTAEEDQRVHAGTKVTAANGDVGALVGPFGKAGKSKVAFAEGTDAAVGSKLALVLGSS